MDFHCFSIFLRVFRFRSSTASFLTRRALQWWRPSAWPPAPRPVAVVGGASTLWAVPWRQEVAQEERTDVQEPFWLWENHGKTMGKPWENHGKTMGKPWENHGKTIAIQRLCLKIMNVPKIQLHIAYYIFLIQVATSWDITPCSSLTT